MRFYLVFFEAIALISISISALAVEASPILKPRQISTDLHCRLAFKQKTKNDYLICMRAEADESLGGVDVCALRVYDIAKSDWLSFSQLQLGVDTNVITIPGVCDAQNISSLLNLPVTDRLAVIQMIRSSQISQEGWTFLLGPKSLVDVANTSLSQLNVPFPKSISHPTPSETVQLPEGGAPFLDQNLPHFQVPIFFGTDRLVKNTFGSQISVSSQRNLDGKLTLGQALVSIPKVHKFGDVESPSIFSFELKFNPDKHIMVQSVEQKSYMDFYSSLAQKVSQSPENDLFLFVHGYNVSFENALRRSAQIAFDLNFGGAPVLYSWPSEGRVWKYFTDEANVEWSFRHLAYFLMDLVNKSGAKRVHIIAHSMGNRALTNALSLLMDKQVWQTNVVQNIVMAAPDLDSGLFEQVAQSIKGTAKKVTLYSSSKDFPLQLSAKFHSYPRVGLNQPQVFVSPYIETLDATKVDSSWLGHSYIGEAARVLKDLVGVLMNGLMPIQRDNLVKRSTPKGPYWEIQP